MVGQTIEQPLNRKTQDLGEDSSSPVDSNGAPNQQFQKPLSKPLTGGISLDLIPINWSKMTETQAIFQIIQFCFAFGPTGNKGVLGKINTPDIFKQIHEIARLTLQKSFGISQKVHPIFKNSMKQQEINRQFSASKNNHAVTTFLNITKESTQYEKSRLLGKVS